jgi:thiosulfate/3-mercaptopyruvate sulfurtransferase
VAFRAPEFYIGSQCNEGENDSMNNLKISLFLLVVIGVIPSISYTRDIPLFVSPEWLDKNLSGAELSIVDIRAAAAFSKSHISHSLSAPFDLWVINKNGLLRELPDDSDLLALMRSLGIKANSKIVVVGRGESDFDRADAFRAAWTILIAGVKNVSVLDGGFRQWIREKKTTTGETSPKSPGEYKEKVNRSMVVSKNYVINKIGKSIILDNRVPEVFFGVTTESWAPKPGHIKSAVNLPAPWVFNQDGNIKEQSELERMASGVVGNNKSKEIISYCGAGPYATVWAYILTEMLGYKNVKVYDGSMQEWIMDPVGPIAIYTWK